MGCGGSKKSQKSSSGSSSPLLQLHRSRESSLSSSDRKHSARRVSPSSETSSRKHSARSTSTSDRKHSARRASSTSDTSDRKQSRLLVSDGENGGGEKPMENQVVGCTKRAEVKPTLPMDAVISIEDETKLAEHGTAETKDGTGGGQTTEESTTEKGADVAGKKQQRLLNFNYLQAKIRSVGSRALVEELSQAREADPQDRDLEQLGLTLQLAQDALKYDPGQLPAQLLARLTQPSPGLVPLLEQCRAVDDVFLLPSQPLVLPPGGPLVHTISEHTANIKCLAMTSDGKYAITCSEDGVMLITDVIKGRRERKILQIGKEPEKVFLCCDDKLIVTTTESHIIAHSLETGAEAWKMEGGDLEGYPACLCFAGKGQDTMVIFEKTTVLLYEASTGKKLDTLGVPQTLDSGVQFNGYDHKACGRNQYAVAVDTDCACLTRVDLTEKNVLSKRMPDPENQEDDDELYIDALAIVSSAEDGQLQAVYSTLEDHDIIFVDLITLDVIKVYKGVESLCPSNFHVTADQRYLYFPASCYGGVCVWDVQDARMCVTLPEANELNDVMTVDMKLFVTITDDRNVRVWDASQGERSPAFDFHDRKVTRVENGEKVVVREGREDDISEKDEEKIKIRDCITTESPRYVLLQVAVNKVYFLHVFDVATSTVVRKMDLGKEVSHITYVRGSRVLVEIDRRLLLVDVDKMEVVTEFRGLLHTYFSADPTLINEGKELLVATKGGHHLKIFDMGTGKVTGIINQGKPERGKMSTLDGLLVSKDCSVAIAELEDNFLVIDLTSRKMKSVINVSELGDVLNVLHGYTAITDDGHYFLFVSYMRLNKDSTSEESRECISVYDLHSGKVVRNVMDTSTALKYTVQKEEYKTTDVSELILLDNSTILIAHDDYVIRVYNMHDGQLLHRLEGHRYVPSLEVRADTPVFLSQVKHTEESAVRLWRKSDFTPLASFTSDTQVDRVILLPGHSEDFLGLSGKSATPVLFSVHGNKKQSLLGQTSPLASYPQLYEGTKLDGVLPSPSDLSDSDPDTDTEDDDEYDSDKEDSDSSW